MGFIKEYRDFISRGNVIDLAIGIVIGAAFNSVVQSFVADVFTPVLGILIGGIDFSDWTIPLIGTAVIFIGKFIQAVLYFFIIAFAVFLLIKTINRFKRKEEAKPVLPSKEEILLTEIRDLLKDRNTKL